MVRCSMTETGWHLEDPRPIAESARYTFFCPSETECRAVRPGDLVKLIFLYDVPTEEWTAERMWVHVTEAGGEGLAGTLGNKPFESKAPLKHGDLVRFEHHHIVDIVFDKPEEAPPPVSRREYWEGCLVDQCVIDGEEPVEYLYREAPDMAQEGDQYPDSGWRIRGRRGDAMDAEYDGREVAYIALGAVLNKDDSWLHLIDTPEGCQFERNFETGEYIRRE
ncbi:hypothetical protein CAP39_08955 [Sphingomonas sp. IBVSS1]|nr:hypothetical protein CAP39_08955 [Sphingomonas sp. IBVSS1]